ncbi:MULTISPECIES: hypothetical protein [unclassified Rhizobium]|uniref:hypothetical protein n=1 Tax=unclassified Rhizobium TaxID=2613769 RepID=UPI001AD9804C|nr:MULTISPECIES: hypothetical protein [unclassified Rhizobium]MBO9101022.1 hypothetical protein [Rhizobium sp. L58/93]MBO9136850.1 hypothetical protein [Rhizobium sp. B209b/85]MBO9171643.1 hypothetical protein [Rhizobium sp. L245/93]MBO9186611.1 hypothetical protein [Rhizobium sp. E27B/91]QXZ86012.1 hypothetical protein J5287_23170 [Rhizobium sp. K1/93]
MTVLADLDALADDNRIVNDFSAADGANAIANAMGHPSLIDLDGKLRYELAGLIAENTATIDAAVGVYPYWSDKQDPDVKRRRCTLALLLTDPSTFTGELGVKLTALATRYRVLLDGLERLGCFFLRRGAIENYYADTSTGTRKPARASAEADRLGTMTPAQLTDEYPELVRALHPDATLMRAYSYAASWWRRWAPFSSLWNLARAMLRSKPWRSQSHRQSKDFSPFTTLRVSTSLRCASNSVRRFST